MQHPANFCGVFAFVPAAVFPQKVNARRSLAPRFLALLENYPPLTHFPFAMWAARAACFAQGIMSNTPANICGGVCVYAPPKILSAGPPYVPAAVLTLRKNADVRPRFAFLRVTPKLSRCSLIFAPRNQRVFLYAVGGFLPDADASAKGECCLPPFCGLRRARKRPLKV